MAVGGDILEVTYNHPTLGSGVFYPKAAEDSTLDMGGFGSSDDTNMIDGGGNMIDQMNRKRWSAEMTVAWDMAIGLELERAQALQSSPLKASWTITHISGAIFGGNGKPVGDIQGNSNAATFTLKIAGDGKLKKIA